MQQEFLDIERAITDIRLGQPVQIKDYAVLSPETGQSASIRKLKNHCDTLYLAIPPARARYLFPKETFEAPIVVKTDENLIKEWIGLSPLAKKPKDSQPANPEAKAAIQLAKIAELLPCMLIGKIQKKMNVAAIEPKSLETYEAYASETLLPVIEAPLTLKYAANASIVAFRNASGKEHYALIIGKPDLSGTPLLRIHSSCFTGDLLTSLACDCRDQLHSAMVYMAENGGGVILYLMQEGRGIGLINKLRTYQLQSQGLDTAEANHYLGFEDDERPFLPAAHMLKKLGISKVRMLTNNPRKVNGLEAHGITVLERIDHQSIPTEHNRQYLATKFSKLGHVTT